MECYDILATVNEGSSESTLTNNTTVMCLSWLFVHILQLSSCFVLLLFKPWSCFWYTGISLLYNCYDIIIQGYTYTHHFPHLSALNKYREQNQPHLQTVLFFADVWRCAMDIIPFSDHSSLHLNDSHILQFYPVRNVLRAEISQFMWQRILGYRARCRAREG